MCRGYMQCGCCASPYTMGPTFYGYYHPLSREGEIQYLKNSKDILERQLNEVQRRIEEIKKKSES